MAKEEKLVQIQAALDEIRPALQFDGGDAELVDFSETPASSSCGCTARAPAAGCRP